MARAPRPCSPKVLQTKEQQLAARAEAVAKVEKALEAGPKILPELLAVVGAKRATLVSYLLHMHKKRRMIRPLAEKRQNATQWVLGADPALPTLDEELAAPDLRPEGRHDASTPAWNAALPTGGGAVRAGGERAQAGSVSTLAWTDAAAALPDDDTLVLIVLNGDDTWTGYRDGDIWRYPDAMPITSERVTHWMHLPAAPGVAS